MKKKIAIIGSGFSGMSAAAYAARAGNEVHVFEKHNQPGGRARQFSTDNGYVFDMGPSWYWMPDVIEGFFQDFGCSASDFYELKKLDPQFEIIFADDKLQIPHSYEDLRAFFERIESGAGKNLDRFMESAKFKYDVGMKHFVEQPCHSWLEFMSPKMLSYAVKLDLFTNFRSYVAKYFKDDRLRTIMEFPVIFLGASPNKIPALYSLMNFGGYALGTHYPQGGFYQVVLAMKKVAEMQGATFHFDKNVEKIIVEDDKVTSLLVDGKVTEFDAVIASSDYHHTESLLPSRYRNYSETYWQSRTFAPSCLIFYLGINEKIPNLKHHTLFFENNFDEHISSIYDTKKWPENPLFYCCCPSKTDALVAPEHGENLFLLMPLAIGMNDQESVREKYLQDMLNRIEQHCGIQGLHNKIEYKRSYCVSDFIKDYNAYGGNAYGLANTMMQTAVLKPKMKNKKIRNLFYAGQLTVPGPGVPPSLISGKIAANEVNNLKIKSYEKTI